MTYAKTAERIKDAGIIAIVRGAFPLAGLVEIGEVLVGSGVRVLEVTLNSTLTGSGDGALGAIAQLKRHFGDRALVGAGTVRTKEDVDGALDAGAAFLVSPNLDLESVARSKERGALHLPGVFTATEAQTAFDAGCTVVKLFPADALGPAYLKALRAPLNDIGFVPTGGIDADNLAAYVRAGAVAVGVGSALVRGADDDLGALAERAKALVSALRGARETHG